MQESRQSKALLPVDAIQHVDGLCHLAKLDEQIPHGDTAEHVARSGLKILEDGFLLGPAHAVHQDIARLGGGRFSHWHQHLYFSSSDGSDPATNGRRYHVLVGDNLQLGPWRQIAAIFETLPEQPSQEVVYSAIERTLFALYPDALLGEDRKLFWRESALLATYARLCGSNRRSFERKFAVINLLKLVDLIEGDIAECGAYEGATAYFIAEALQSARQRRAIHLFDSFQGLSSPGSADGDFWTMGSLTASEAKTTENLAQFDNVRIYKGWIPERFSEIAGRRFALVHIDVDLHAPTLHSLEFFYPRMQRGGLIICDDYGFTTCPGATAAVNEFMMDKIEQVVHLPTGQAFIMKS